MSDHNLDQRYYHGNQIEVSSSPGDGETIFVTFTNYSVRDNRGIGFGKQFFRKRDVPALMFTSNQNQWWQNSEIFEAIDAVNNSGLLSNYSRRVGYGSSMGAYGALLFSRRLDLTEVRAFSPQYSIDPIKAPFEDRFRKEAAKIDFLYDRMEEELSYSANITIFFDPLDLDGKHAKLFANSGRSNITFVRLGFAGHTVTHPLQNMGLLTPLLCSEPLSHEAIHTLQQKFRADRRSTPMVLLNLCRSLLARRRYGELIQCARHVTKLRPDDLAAHKLLSIAYEEVGDLPAAIAYLQRAIALGEDKELRRRLARLENNAGLTSRAVETLRALIAENPRHVFSFRDLAIIRHRQGRKNEAIELIKAALEIDPEDAQLHRLMAMWTDR